MLGLPQLLALLIETAEEQSAENAARLAALAIATEKIEGIIPFVQKAASEAINIGVEAALVEITTEADGELRSAARWRVFALASIGLAGVCIVWWQRYQIEVLIEQKTSLQMKVFELQTSVENLKKKDRKN